MKEIFRIKSILQFYEILGLDWLFYFLIFLIEDRDVIKKFDLDDKLFNIRFFFDLYFIMYKDKISGLIGYGRNIYDF